MTPNLGPHIQLDSIWEIQAEPVDLRKRIAAKLRACADEIGDRDPMRGEGLRDAANLLERA